MLFSAKAREMGVVSREAEEFGGDPGFRLDETGGHGACEGFDFVKKGAKSPLFSQSRIAQVVMS